MGGAEYSQHSPTARMANHARSLSTPPSIRGLTKQMSPCNIARDQLLELVTIEILPIEPDGVLGGDGDTHILKMTPRPDSRDKRFTPPLQLLFHSRDAFCSPFLEWYATRCLPSA